MIQPTLEECEVFFEPIFGITRSLSNILAKTNFPIVDTVDQNIFEALALTLSESKSTKMNCDVLKSVLHRFSAIFSRFHVRR